LFEPELYAYGPPIANFSAERCRRSWHRQLEFRRDCGNYICSSPAFQLGGFWLRSDFKSSLPEILFLPKNISPRVSREEYMSEHIHHVADATFEQEVLQASLPVLVDYWADWCGPCKMIAPILDEIAQEYAGRLKVTKLNIDDNQKTPAQYGIRGIPTLMIFKNGNVEATKVGALSKSQLTAFIDSHI